MLKGQYYPDDEPLAERLASDPVSRPPCKPTAVARRISFLLAVIGMIGLVLGLARTCPEAIGFGVMAAVFAVPPALLARRIVRSLVAHGEAMPASDRLAAFLCMALFTVPLQMILLIPLLVLFELASGGID
jgi:hypothetical protein